ncbi:MAG: GNAT family N-acetyltransferase [Candidatus Eisenbacteria bacterium]|nr:GNAT family N-acetyltransferase [Candidatus Eisenbacteria bacterium]
MIRYPRAFRCRDGRVVTVRPLERSDLEPLLEFFASLPEEDRLHLRVDVTQREIVRRRLSPLPHWNVLRLIALNGERIVAEASVAHRTYGFEAHVGEARLLVAESFRHCGLGSYLSRQLLAHGITENLEKVEVHLMDDQLPVIRFFERLGFERDGVLKDFVKDIRDRHHNLLIMSLRT